MESKKEYRTKDLAEAGALLLTNQNLMRIDREGKTCFFVFEDQVTCTQISSSFFFGKLLVNAREYYETLSRLKNRIFSTEDEYGKNRRYS